MKNNNGVVYEKITVLAVHILNASEIPFEKDGHVLLQRYQRFLLECSEIMLQGNRCMDVLLCNNSICCIWAGRCNETVKKAAVTAVRIENLVEKINRRNTYDGLERIIAGIGIASGTAVVFTVCRSDQEKGKRVWLGSVMEKASYLSRTAIRYGERKIMAEHKIYDYVCDIVRREEL